MRSSTAVDQDARPGSSERWGFLAGLAAVGVIAYWMSVWFPYQIRSPSLNGIA